MIGADHTDRLAPEDEDCVRKRICPRCGGEATGAPYLCEPCFARDDSHLGEIFDLRTELKRLEDEWETLPGFDYDRLTREWLCERIGEFEKARNMTLAALVWPAR